MGRQLSEASQKEVGWDKKRGAPLKHWGSPPCSFTFFFFSLFSFARYPLYRSPSHLAYLLSELLYEGFRAETFFLPYGFLMDAVLPWHRLSFPCFFRMAQWWRGAYGVREANSLRAGWCWRGGVCSGHCCPMDPRAGPTLNCSPGLRGILSRVALFFVYFSGCPGKHCHTHPWLLTLGIGWPEGSFFTWLG